MCLITGLNHEINKPSVKSHITIKTTPYFDTIRIEIYQEKPRIKLNHLLPLIPTSPLCLSMHLLLYSNRPSLLPFLLFFWSICISFFFVCLSFFLISLSLSLSSSYSSFNYLLGGKAAGPEGWSIVGFFILHFLFGARRSEVKCGVGRNATKNRIKTSSFFKKKISLSVRGGREKGGR